MRASWRLGLVVFALGCGARTRSPAINRIAAEHEVRTAEQQWFEALVKQDVAALEALLDEDMSFVHTDGETQSKDEVIEMVRSRRLVFESIDPSDLHVRVYDGAAVVTGLSQIKLRWATGVSSFKVRFTETYVRRGNRWFLAALQATGIST